jgi:hypothetical protein
MATPVDDYIAKLPAWQAALALELARTVLEASPNLAAAIKWGQPVFESNGPVCYLKGHKRHLTLGFWRGAALMKMDGRLETSGEKMAHMKFFEGEEVNQARIAKLVSAAVELNRTLGDPNTRRSKTASQQRGSKR